jgi:hypothetical protein
MSTGLIFLVVVFAGFFIFATQAGAAESSLNAKLGPGGWLFLLLIIGVVLWFLMSGTHVALLH